MIAPLTQKSHPVGAADVDADIRHFRVDGETVRGDSGQIDADGIATELSVIQKYAQRRDAQFGIRGISHGIVFRLLDRRHLAPSDAAL